MTQQIPRSLKFCGNFQTLAPSQFRPSANSILLAPQPTNQTILSPNCPSLFDRYNRNMLRLDQCDPIDLLIVNNTPVVYQEVIPLSLLKVTEKKVNRNDYSRQTKVKGNITDLRLKVSSVIKQTTIQQKEFEQNQLLFNYKKIAQNKMEQKKKFLQKMEIELTKLEKQTEQVENYQQQSRQTYKEALLINQKIKKSLNPHLEKVLNQQQLQPVNIYMRAQHINSIVEQQIDANNELLDAVNLIVKPQKNHLTNPELFIKQNRKTSNMAKTLDKTINKTMKIATVYKKEGKKSQILNKKSTKNGFAKNIDKK